MIGMLLFFGGCGPEGQQPGSKGAMEEGLIGKKEALQEVTAIMEENGTYEDAPGGTVLHEALVLFDILGCTEEEWRRMVKKSFEWDAGLTDYFSRPDNEEKLNFDVKWGLCREGLYDYFDGYEIWGNSGGIASSVIAFEDLPLKIELHPEQYRNNAPIP